MPKYKVKDEIEFLKDNGFHLKSERGDHHKYTNRKGMNAIVVYSSFKDTVSPGVHKDIHDAVKGISKWQKMKK